MFTALLTFRNRSAVHATIASTLLLLTLLCPGLARAQPPAWDQVMVWADDYDYRSNDGQVIESYDANGHPILIADDAGRLERALAATDLTGCLGISGKFYVSRPIDIGGKCILGVHHWREAGFEIIAARGAGPTAPAWGPGDAVLFAQQAFKLDAANVYGEQVAAYGIHVQGVSASFQVEIRGVSVQDTLTAGVYVADSRGLVLDNLGVKRNQGDGIVLDRVAGSHLVTVRSTFNVGHGIHILGDHPTASGTSAAIDLRYPLVEQNPGNAIWIQDRTQPVSIRGGWLEGQLGHGVLIQDSENIDVRNTNVSGSRHPLASGFDPSGITLHGDSRNNTVEDNYQSNGEPVALGWTTDSLGNTAPTDLASNTVRNNWHVRTQYASYIFDPATQILDPANPDTVDSSPYCGDGYVDPGEHCDDGNRENADGCNEDCQTEYCGDGVRQNSATMWEECDRGDANGPGGSCSASCEDLTGVSSDHGTHRGVVRLSDFNHMTDDTARLKAALGAAGKYNCVEGAGTLLLRETVWVGARCLKGAGGGASSFVLKADPTAAWSPGQPLLESGADAFVLERLNVDANHVVDFGIHALSSHSARIENSRFEHALLAGIYLEHTNVVNLRGVTTANNAGDGAWFESMSGSYAETFHAIGNGGSGLKVFAGGPKPPFEKDPCLKAKSGGMYLDHPTARNNGGHGIEIIATGSPVIVDGATIEGNQLHGLRLFKAQQAVVRNSLISGGDASDSFEDYAISVDFDSWGCTIRDNVVGLEDPAAIDYPVLAFGERELNVPLPEGWNRWQDNVYDGGPLPVAVAVPTCPNLISSPLYLFDTGLFTNGDMDGRRGADALALAAVPPGLFPGNYSARALLGGDGFGLKNFPHRLCFDPNHPVIGVDSSGAITGTVADNWADFTDGSLKMPIAAAVGASPASDAFWTGTDNLGEWSRLDCCGWEYDLPGVDDATISHQMDATFDWMADPNRAGSCNASFKLLGIALATP